MDKKRLLINRLEEARSGLEEIIPHLALTQEIYPDWTIKQMLDHIAGWDDAVIASLRAHINGRAPDTPADRGIDFYNAQTVSTRESLDFEHTYREFRQSRLLLKETIQALPESKLTEPFIVPWGPTGTISEVIDIFAEHEEAHTADILRLVKDMDYSTKG